MEHLEIPDRHTLCDERGVGTEHPDYSKLLKYAGATEWLVGQHQDKTSLVLPDNAHHMLADILIAGVYIDRASEASARPNWNQSFEPITFANRPTPDSEGSSFWRQVPVGLSKSVARNFTFNDEQQEERLELVWDAMLESMYDHRLVATANTDIKRVIGTRVMEAVSMSDLFCAVLFEDDTEYIKPFFNKWLALQLAAGNLLDSVIDYKEDLRSGHRELSATEKALYTYSALAISFKYLMHPMTSRKDQRLMIRKVKKLIRE